MLFRIHKRATEKEKKRFTEKKNSSSKNETRSVHKTEALLRYVLVEKGKK